MNLGPSSTMYWHESVLMREETGVPGENSRIQVEIYWNSEVRGVIDDHYLSLTPEVLQHGRFPRWASIQLSATFISWT